MKTLNLLLTIAVLSVVNSCGKECNVAENFSNDEVERLSFISKEALESAIDKGPLKIRSQSILEGNLFFPITTALFASDPILSVECAMLGIDSDALQGPVFDVLRYDLLVPNKSFAALLNYRGEIEVKDTIYKVSPKGTYYFHKNYIKSFEEEYNYISSSELQPIGNDTYVVIIPHSELLFGKIYLKDTFGNGCSVLNEDDESATTLCGDSFVMTRGAEDDRWKEALDINWNSLDKHYTDAKTWAGEVIQGVVGRNVSFKTEFDSKHRLKAKLYYYDYAVYSEIGALSKMQKKNWIGWSGKDAEKIYQIWSNMVIWTPFTSVVKYPHVNDGAQIPRFYLGTQIEKIPGIGREGVVSYFAGRDLSEQELSQFASTNFVKSVIDLKIDIDKDKLDSRTMAAKYITEKGVYTVIYPYGKMIENGEEIQSKFSKDFHISIGASVTPGALPDSFKGWLQTASATSLKTPDLIQGEMRTAAKYNGVIKGMRLIKAR